jgi:hypothetical protein
MKSSGIPAGAEFQQFFDSSGIFCQFFRPGSKPNSDLNNMWVN